MMDQINWDCLQRMHDAKFESWYVIYSEGEWEVSATTPSGDDYVADALSLEHAVGRLFGDIARG